ncbi:hypothetical protein WJT86_06565 [Microvirga sp. W0021]|uniref:Uncharacterized protein n=1 Tax=Hohaiivirga grylli TaxID=3133970 RepID=A0ABV0BIE0_9HYPH
MAYDQILFLHKLAIYGWLPAMTAIFVVMAIKVLKKLVARKSIKEATIYTPGIRHRIAFLTLIYMLPAIIIYVVLLIPAFYINHQAKQYDYCLQVVRVNKLKTTDSRILQQRCSSFDLNELIRNAENPDFSTDE